ncbi:MULTISPECIES: UDP-N-acetylglucosamine 2-epimerase [unclassified Exiguobacterium]|uniref:UDP-N-acetylglucosamine 2-epimerase n=1 Tax=unclassified Exiguobacterium TaxID=2644629 RepID=UPI001BE78875|nr:MULTISPECIES: UDP-N-acetylglucosamine 2-epimerase [unclassified Exiguobacterium]
MKKIAFLTGTRADYGKLKSLMKKIKQHNSYELSIFVTGMHMLSKYGSTHIEIEKDGFSGNTYKFINQHEGVGMDTVLSNTIMGFGNYIKEVKPDLIIIHGDRVEALAGATVGALNNVKVLHIEGGEVSGTIDESIRHAVTKFSHLHLVSNEQAKNRVIQLGEPEESIHIFGSPDLDVMFSNNLPELKDVKDHYDIPFEEYAVVMYHSVTTEVHLLSDKVKKFVDALVDSNKNYIVIYPNNDEGSSIILNEYARLNNNSKFKVYPSIRFEAFLTLLKNAEFIIGNSSAGIREASAYGVPSIDVGTRQSGRYSDISTIISTCEEKNMLIDSINKTSKIERLPISHYGNGNSADIFIEILENGHIWESEQQKKFVTIDL